MKPYRVKIFRLHSKKSFNLRRMNTLERAIQMFGASVRLIPGKISIQTKPMNIRDVPYKGKPNPISLFKTTYMNDERLCGVGPFVNVSLSLNFALQSLCYLF